MEEAIELRRLVRLAIGPISLLAAVIHASAVSPHLSAHVLHGLAFAMMAAFQAVWAYAILRSANAGARTIGMLGHGSIVVLWLWTRSVGLPAWVPGSAGVEAVEIKDAVATLFALIVIAGIGVLSAPRLGRRLVAPSAAGAAVTAAAAALALLTVPAVVGSSNAHGLSHSHDRPAPITSSEEQPLVDSGVEKGEKGRSGDQHHEDVHPEP